MGRDSRKDLLRKALADIDQELATYTELLAERKRIVEALSFDEQVQERVLSLLPAPWAKPPTPWADLEARNWQTLDELARSEATVHIRDAAVLEVSNVSRVVNSSRFKPNPNSKAARIVDETRRLLERTPDRMMPFLNAFRLMPSEVFGGLQHPREYMRTALLRSGYRGGVVYRKGMLSLATTEENNALGKIAEG